MKKTIIGILVAVIISLSFTGKPTSYTPNTPQWIKITKTFSDFSTASLTNSITVYSLPAKGVIHSVQVYANTVYSGGTIATYTISVGISGSNAKYAIAANVFTGATLAPINILSAVESMSGATNITATAISTVGLLSAATQGSVDIYILVSTLP